ncbi:MAG: gliding motility-associated C-terminal domain-containing protein [Bacteroidetes bacterium]|nr:gliding motility-associated C-terminal domain-containing protein [Bacteroidota bacterium]
MSELSAQSMYVSMGSADIYLVNPNNCSSSLVFSSSNASWLDIALCQGNPNVIYALGQGNTLYQIDLSTSQLTLLSNQFSIIYPGNHQLNALVCDGNGILYAADGFSSSLYSFNLSTSAWNFIGSPNGYTSAGDLVFYNGTLYMSTYTNEIISIIISPFSVSSVVPMSAVDIFGLGISTTTTLCSPGTNYMVGTSGNNLYSVDPLTGSCTLMCPNITPLTGSIGGIASILDGINPPVGLLQIYASDTSICFGSSTILSSIGASSYVWLPGNFTSDSITVQPSVTTTYSVIGTDSSGCSDTVQLTINVDPPIVLNANSQMTSCFGFSDGSATVNASGGQSPYVYVWSPSGATTATATNLAAGTYTVLITGADGCAATQIVSVTSPTAVQVAVAATPEYCASIDGSASVTASGGTPGYTYLWSNSATASSISNLTAGIYTVTVTDANGCIITQTDSVGTAASAIADAGISVTITNGQTIILNGSGGGTYSWSPSGSLDCSTCQNPTASPIVTTTYTLTVIDSHGCIAVDSVTIYVDANCGDVFIPNAFSPNHDNQNDVLYVRGNCIRQMQFEIYNRWGEKVFETSDPSVGWDGMWRGEACETAVFTYLLRATLIDGKEIEKQGNISLVK